MSTFVHADPADQAGFTIIPNAVLRNPSLSLGAKTVYGVIKSHAWKDDSAVPGLERIGGFLGVTEETVRKYVKELVEAKLVKVVRRGQGRTNQYVILPLTPTNTSVLDDDEHRGLDDDAASHEVDEVEEDEEKDLATDKQSRKRNIVWDCLLEAGFAEPVTSSEKSDFGKTVRELRAVIPETATAEEIVKAIRARRAAWERTYPDAAFTHHVLRNKWGELAALVNGRDGPSSSDLPGPLTPEAFRAWRSSASREQIIEYQHRYDVDDSGESLADGF